MANKTLNAKQQAFINEYLQCWNAAEAARRAGYSELTARSIGAENLTKPDIAKEIRDRIIEMTMSADEALVRLSEHARADMSDFVSSIGTMPYLDLEKATARNKLHLLKKFKTTDKGVEIELYDAQAALVHILKEQHLKSGEPTDRSAFVDESLTDDERADRIASLLERARARRDGQAASGND